MPDNNLDMEKGFCTHQICPREEAKHTNVFFVMLKFPKGVQKCKKPSGVFGNLTEFQTIEKTLTVLYQLVRRR